MDANLSLLNGAESLDLAALLLDLDTGVKVLGHLLSGNAYELGFKLEALSRFES